MKKILLYIESDYYRYTGKRANPCTLIRKAFFGRSNAFRYSFWLRLSHFKNPFRTFAKLILKILSDRYKIFISWKSSIGYGLYIGGPPMCIIVNGGATFGNNVNISQFLNIGSNKKQFVTIGNNVYIGPHVCITDGVTIGDNATIGAGAVVTKPIPQNATAMGIPAKVTKYDNPGRFILNAVDWM